jgi:restriction endonuclease S subunit
MRDGWTAASIGEIANIQQGATLAIGSLEGGEFPVFGANGIVGFHSAYNFDFEVVALGCRGSCGSIHLVTSPSWLANNVMAIWPKSKSQSSARFLALILEISDFRISGVISGQVQPQITRKSLSPLPIHVPPIAEQKRIVDLVSSVDAYIDALQQQVETARTARNAVLHELLTTGGPDWTETSLGDAVRLVQGKYLPKEEYVDDGPYWIYGSNSVMGRYSQPLVYEPHIVMAAIGANAGAVRYSQAPSWINNNAFAILPNGPEEPFFLFLWLENVLSSDQILAGTGQPYVRRPALLEQTIALPPIEEQRKIVDIVSSIDDVVQTAERAVSDAKSLRSGLLSSLLSGEHEIPASYDSLLGAT